MSYAKVRALTRIATPQTDAGLAELAGPMTAGQLDRFVAAHRRVSHVDDEHAEQVWRLVYRVEEDGSVAMTIRLPAVDGAVVLQALRAAVGDSEHPHQPEPGGGADVPAGTPPPVTPSTNHQPSSLADALVDVASAFLASKAHHMIVHASGYLITSARGAGFTFTRPDGDVVAASPQLPGGDGDVSGCHDAEVTPSTIVPSGLADRFDLDLSVWACFANAKIAAER
jgi:hypothetical protein